MDRLEGASNRNAAKERFRVISFETNLSTTHSVWAIIGAHPFTAELAWNRHRFYATSFFQESRLRRKRVHDEDNAF